MGHYSNPLIKFPVNLLKINQKSHYSNNQVCFVLDSRLRVVLYTYVPQKREVINHFEQLHKRIQLLEEKKVFKVLDKNVRVEIAA